MLSIIKGIYQQCFAYPDYNICLLGIQQTGKTNLLNHIKNINNSNYSQKVGYKPTVGLNVTKWKSKKGKLCIWDLGGRKGLRKIWQHYYPQCHGLVYIIDERIEQGFNNLLNVLFHQDMASIPLLIVTSNQQIKDKVRRLWDSLQKNQALNRQIQIHANLNSNFKIENSLNLIYDKIYILHKSVM